jgi:DNA-binding SARP family transcriptional activator
MGLREAKAATQQNIETSASRFRVRTFGGLTVEGNVPASMTQRKRLAFLALLAAAESGGIARERLLLLLWPESTTERARGALYQLLYVVRQAFGDTSVVGTDELRLDPTVVSSDVADFHAALARDDLASAAELYRGPFLDAFHVSGAPELERWLDQKRHELAQSYQSALSRLTTQAMEQSDFPTAVGYAKRLVDADPLSDRAIVLLMEALAASGDVTAALDRARVHAAVVRAELGADVDPSVTALADRLRSGPAALRPPVAREVAATIHQPLPKAGPMMTDRAAARWRKATIVLATLVMVIVAVGVAMRRSHDRAPEFIVVADFGTSQADTGIADLLTNATRRALSASLSLRAVPDSRLAGARRRLHVPTGARLTDSVARQLALGEGIRSVVAGSLTRMGESFALSLKLISASSGDVLTTAEQTGVASDKLIVALDTLSRVLRARAGDDLEVIRAQPSLLALTSTSLEAMTAYVAALHAPRDRVEALLRQAVALDTSFAVALWQLARSIENSGSREERRSLLARAYAHREGLTEYERLRVEIAYLYSPDGQTPSRETMVARLRQIVEQYPNAGDAIILANFYLSRREFAPAESTFRLAIALDSTLPDAYVGAINVLLRVKRNADARKTVDALVLRFPGLRAFDAFVSYAEGRRGRAREIAEAGIRKPGDLTRAQDYYLRSTVNLLDGRLGEWKRDVRTTDSLNYATRGVSGLPMLDLWADHWVRDRPADGLRILDAALAADTTKRSLDAAELYAQFDRPEQAWALVKALDPGAHDEFAQGSRRRLVMGWIHLARGEPLKAIEEFRKSQSNSDGPVMASEIVVDPAIGLAFERAALPDSAIVAYEHYLTKSPAGYLEDNSLKLAWVLEHMAGLYDVRGRRKEARDAYTQLAGLWKDADAELQPRVLHARERIAALSR